MSAQSLSLSKLFAALLVLALLVSACGPPAASFSPGAPGPQPAQAANDLPATPTPPLPTPVPYPTRPVYAPGELVDYIAQTGDTLPLLALRFNTSVEEILAANSFIPRSATTMPPGMPMKIPVYFLPFWGNPYQILPDSLFINGPAQVGFDTQAFVAAQPGWLKDYIEYAADANRSGADLVDYIALKWSLSPRLLLALLEYQSGALSNPTPDPLAKVYPMGYRSRARDGLFLQLAWAANALNGAYYGIRSGQSSSLEHEDGRIERFDPWQNPATAALHIFFNQLYGTEGYARAINPEGFATTYRTLFGDPWTAGPHLPGSLEQPTFSLPFEPGSVWAYTGGPHTGWGTGQPLAALDFAPPSVASGCKESSEWATAVAAGIVARSEFGEVVLDLDGDGDERTGWVVFYLHVATAGRVPAGVQLQAGDPVGHPSCEGGTSTGTHIHIARKYNGEWILAEGTLAFNLEGWIAHNGSEIYRGTLTKMNRTVTASQNANHASFIQSERP